MGNRWWVEGSGAGCRIAALALAPALAACGGPAATNPAATTAPAATCSATFLRRDVAFTPAPEAPVPVSRLAVRGVVPEKLVLSVLEAQVPTTLDRGRRTQSGVRVDYVVTRGPFGLKLEDDQAVVETMIQAKARACKKLGPVCLGVGGCRPRFLSRTRIPYKIGPGLTPPKVRLDVVTKAGCRILVMDVTGRLTAQARSEAKKVEARINRELGRHPDAARRGLRAMQQPRQLDDDLCVQFEPDGAELVKPQRVNGKLTLGAMVAGKLRVASRCDELAASTQKDVDARWVDRLSGSSRLRATIPLPLARVRDALTDQLKGRLDDISLRTAAVDGEARLIIEGQAIGEGCGAVRFAAGLRPLGKTIRLGPVTAHATDGPAAALEALGGAIAKVTLPTPDLSEQSQRLQKAVKGALPQLETLPIKMTAEVRVPPLKMTNVVVSGEALRVEVGTDPTISLVVQ